MDYRQILKQHFETRRAKNNRYSQRAFARDLELSPGYLTQVLKGDRNLSVEKAAKIVKQLKFGNAEMEIFLEAVQLANRSTPSFRAFLENKSKSLVRMFTPKHAYLNERNFRHISDWYYGAILALSEVKGFKITSETVAARLGISPKQSQEAMDYLVHVGLLKENELGQVCPNEALVKVASIPSSAIRKHHEQFLKKARQALYRDRPEDRDISGTTLAVNPNKLPEAKALIEEFREKLAACLTDPGENSAVYRLSLQLFRIDEPDQK